MYVVSTGTNTQIEIWISLTYTELKQSWNILNMFGLTQD